MRIQLEPYGLNDVIDFGQYAKQFVNIKDVIDNDIWYMIHLLDYGLIELDKIASNYFNRARRDFSAEVQKT